MSEHEARPSWFDRNPKKTIAIVIIAVWIFLDTTAAQIFPRREIGTPSPYYHHDLKKSFKLDRNIQGRSFSVYTNSLGFIDSSSRAVPLVSDKYRVLFIGDSFTEGIGYPFQQTFIGLLDDRIDRSRIELLDAGVRSYSPKLYYLKMKYLVETLGLKINELYVLIDISDIQDEIAYENYVPGDASYLLARIDVWLKDRFLSYRNITEDVLGEALSTVRQKLFGTDDMIHAWGSRRDLWQDLSQYVKERDRWLSDEAVFERWGRRGVEFAEKNMSLLLDLCKRHGIKATLVVYPWPEQAIQRELNCKQVTIWKDFAEQRGIEFINCFPYFMESPDGQANVKRFFLANDVHWNENGHKLMADILWDHIRKINP
jgi:hypothetical protein